MLSEQSVEQFRVLCRKHYGVELSPEQAREQAVRFFNLCKVLAYPLDEAGGITHAPESE